MRLLDLLQAIAADPTLRTRVTPRGGTALNVFHLPLDRLSVNIDLNYVGALAREAMEADRPVVQASFAGPARRRGLPGHSPAGGSCRRQMGGALRLGAGRLRA